MGFRPQIQQIEGLETELNAINGRIDTLTPQNVLITAAQLNFRDNLIGNCINTVEWFEAGVLKQTQYNSNIVLNPKPTGLLKRFTIFYISIGTTGANQQIYAREGTESADPQMIYVTTGEFLVGTALIDSVGVTPVETTNLENVYHWGAGGSNLDNGRTEQTRFASAEKAAAMWLTNRNFSIYTKDAGTFTFNIDLSGMFASDILNIYAPNAILDWSDIPLQLSAGTVRMTIGRGVGEINVLTGALLRFNQSTVLRGDLTVQTGAALYAPQINQGETFTFDAGSIIRIGQAECTTLVQNSTDIVANITAGGVTTLYPAIIVPASEPPITGGLITQFWSGLKTFRDLMTDVRAGLLTGYITGTNQVISATDSFLTAFRNLQAQISAQLITLGTKVDKVAGKSLVLDTEIAKIHLADRIEHTGNTIVLQSTFTNTYPDGNTNAGFLQEFILTSPTTIEKIAIDFGSNIANNGLNARLDLFSGTIINFNSYPPFTTYGTGDTGNLTNGQLLASANTTISAGTLSYFNFLIFQVLPAGTYHFAIYKDSLPGVVNSIYLKFNNVSTQAPNVGRSCVIGVNGTGKFSYIATSNLQFKFKLFTLIINCPIFRDTYREIQPT